MTFTFTGLKLFFFITCTMVLTALLAWLWLYLAGSFVEGHWAPIDWYGFRLYLAITASVALFVGATYSVGYTCSKCSIREI